MNTSKFFLNKECEYYPCHNIDSINCLFCFCPLYSLNCPGTPKYIGNVKDCSECTFPHQKENYDTIIKLLTQK